LSPRFFLVAAENLPAQHVITCAEAAAKAGDCVSILVPGTYGRSDVASLQALGFAVLINDASSTAVHDLNADGLHCSKPDIIRALREELGDKVIGAFAATSRHAAMEAAESGADYIAFAQKSQFAGEPLIAWWQDIFEVPTIAFDPVGPEDLATLLPQKPDFIRPGDDMWSSPDKATKTIAALASQFKS
jgi:thiamine-phosphate pyrophosphorylase